MSGLSVGSQQVSDSASEFNAMRFIVRMMMGKAAHAYLAKVVSVTNDGGLVPAGTVSVTPLVNQVDGSGNAAPTSDVENLPYFRLCGTAGWKIICDPAVGEIGVAIVCDRDTSAVRATGAQANPGSARQNNEADGLFFGGFMDADDFANVIQLSAAGANIITAGNITWTAQNSTMDADGNLTTKGDVTWNTGSTATVASTHTHGDVQSGSSQTAAPTAGS